MLDLSDRIVRMSVLLCSVWKIFDFSPGEASVKTPKVLPNP